MQPGWIIHDSARIQRYGKGFDTETLEAGAGSLSFCGFSGFSVVLLGFPAGFPTLPGLF